jgi:hypothetical protein
MPIFAQYKNVYCQDLPVGPITCPYPAKIAELQGYARVTKISKLNLQYLHASFLCLKVSATDIAGCIQGGVQGDASSGDHHRRA